MPARAGAGVAVHLTMRTKYPLKDIRFNTIKANYPNSLLSIRHAQGNPDGWKCSG
jgi:hypothetical protein